MLQSCRGVINWCCRWSLWVHNIGHPTHNLTMSPNSQCHRPHSAIVAVVPPVSQCHRDFELRPTLWCRRSHSAIVAVVPPISQCHRLCSATNLTFSIAFYITSL
ncbi:hypothetical protein Pcinc_031651 [Petrolisthes cinctipes]|uniref:Uncharacterized protein n=1 Tax=Petrolisthes cinctipes TaxID=88211 RepID=A0AAE1K2B7_PETCI|nr:hypothetical protein Pcinc_031651 [Petrolisthes cinctipes]